MTETTQKIAAALGETEKSSLHTIERIIKVLGEERALTLLDETLKIETEGDGMLTDDGSRCRSPGGVFFKLVKNQTTSRERWLIFISNKRTAKPKETKPKTPPVTWEEIEQISGEVLDSPGEANTMKLTLIGKPGRIVEKGEVVLTSMQGKAKVPSLPKGLPQPPSEPTTYLIFIAMKQWRKVKDSITKNPDDKLIIEGYPVFDRRIGQTGSMTVYAQMVTTTLLQRAKREAQQTAAKG